MKLFLKQGLSVSLALVFLLGAEVSANAEMSAKNTSFKTSLSQSVSRDADYSEVSAEYPEYNQNLDELSFSATDILLNNGIARITDDGAVVSSASKQGLDFKLSVNKSGRYYISFDYRLSETAKSSEAVRSVLIDGTLPFSEAKRVSFERSFKDEGEITLDTAGDEIRPDVVEVRERKTILMYDGGAFYDRPLEFYFEVGEHILTLGYVSCDLDIYGISLIPASDYIDYKTLSADYEKKSNERAIIKTFQAESSMISRSDSSIRMESNSDPKAVPRALGYKKLNVVGGFRWRKGNQSISFSFSVPSNGYYKLSIRFLQNWNDGLPSYRRIAIDRKVPCKELAAYRFNYSDIWQTETLNINGEDMLFYLEKGEHTLTMTVTMGELSSAIRRLYDNMLVVSDMLQSINKLTGSDADANYDYEFFKNIPSLEGDLGSVSENLYKIADELDKITAKSTSMSGNLRSTASQLEKMKKDPYSIARRIDWLTTAQTNLGTYYSNMQLLPLMMDEFSFSSEGADIKPRKANVFEKIATSCYNFAISFMKDYNGVAGISLGDTEIIDTIDVWVARGTEWAQAIKYLADSDFTPKTGILVDMDVVPGSQLNTGSANVLLLSLVSGTAPDVAMGVSVNSPVEFAIRDAVYDLSKFDDFDTVSQRFINKIFTPFEYKGGVYALPETMNYTCLFYRTDIFSKYNFTVPDTWDELYYTLLPKLYRNGMQFYMPQDFTMFLYQHGGEFYSEDGLSSALNSDKAYDAFKEYTEVFTNYSSPVSANFLTRFRTGEMPIGVGSFAFYIQLSTAAPELVGNWEMAPLLGKIKADGSINRSAGALAAECDIILASGDKKDSAWEFLKWWSEDKTQITYAGELESSIGVEARWNSANVEAFSSLDWSINDTEVIDEMWIWARETPVVLGSYYTTRYINNAFNSVVVSGNLTVRDALEEAVEAINRELKSKQIEYGVIGSE